MIVWMVQQFVGGVWDDHEQKWGMCEFELTGIYDSEQKAIDACRNDKYVIAPIELNYTFPEERVQIPGSYYPLAKDIQKEGDNSAKEKIATK